MTVAEDVERIAGAAAAFAAPGEELAGVLVAETLGRRVYLCAFESAGGRAWLALDAGGATAHATRVSCGKPPRSPGSARWRRSPPEAGDLPELRARLAEIRETDDPVGIEEAEGAAAALAETLAAGAAGRERRVPRRNRFRRAPARAGARRRRGASPFATAMQAAAGSVEELAADVERNHKLPLT